MGDSQAEDADQLYRRQNLGDNLPGTADRT
jgi:hypothetical protein